MTNMVVKEAEKVVSMDSSTNGGILGTVRKRWPAIANSVYGPFTYPHNWYSIQIAFWCALFWPGDPLDLHYAELSIAFGMMFVIGAFSKLVFGQLADRHSRIKLMGIACVAENIAFFCIGFIPAGLGFTSYTWLMVIVIARECFTAFEVIKNSYIDDAVEEGKRSQFIGIIQMVSLLVSVLAMVFIPFAFKTEWRSFFLIIGGLGVFMGVIILAKGAEPKRGAEKQELKNVLSGETNYTYKLSRKTIKTLLSGTNLVVIVEGIFTQIIIAVPSLLAFAYIESPPFNISPLSVSLFGLFFAIPGSMIGAVGFSKLSDRLSKRNVKNRIFLLLISLLVLYLVWVAFFFIPFKPLTPAEGDNISIILGDWTYYLWAIIVIVAYMMMGVYNVNQIPLLQKVNLPEAQGTVSALDKFFEILSVGIGAMISGLLLGAFDGNYQLTVLVLMVIGYSGTTLWLVGYRVIDKDIALVSSILDARAREIKQDNGKP